jgi:hypothetical protein
MLVAMTMHIARHLPTLRELAHRNPYMDLETSTLAA